MGVEAVVTNHFFKPAFWLDKTYLIIGVFLAICCLYSSVCQAQFYPEKTALHKLEKKEWRKVRKILLKSLLKDSASIEAKYVYSLYFFERSNPKFHLDSAKQYLLSAIEAYGSTDKKKKERLARFPLDSALLIRLNEQIDSMAFLRAKASNKEEDYLYFLEQFRGAAQTPLAIELRDEAAFNSALKKNTHLSFFEFLTKYPESHRATDAKQHYDKLLFDYRTRSNTVEEYEAFLHDFPESPYRMNALEKIFQFTTLNGEKENFRSFLIKYPGNKFSEIASKLLKFDHQSTGYGKWIPVFENGYYGFLGLDGQIKVNPKFTGLPEDYRCLQDDREFILAEDGVYDRKGEIIHPGIFHNVLDLGSGFILLKGDTGSIFMHRSGWHPFNFQVQNAVVILDRFLALKNSNQWGIRGLNGYPILDHVYDSIYSVNGHIVLKKNIRHYVLQPDNLLKFSIGKAEAVVVDEVRAIGEHYLLTRIGPLEQVLGNNLEPVVPLDRHKIRYAPFGFTKSKNKAINLIGWPTLKNETFSNIEIFEPWMITKQEGKVNLYYIPSQSMACNGTDSIWFKNHFAFALKGDSLNLFSAQNKKFTTAKDEQVQFLSGQDSTFYFVVSAKEKKTIFDAVSGKKILSGKYQSIQSITREFFLVKQKGKTGLVNNSGRQLLPLQYDAILYQNGWFSLLNEKKFGAYNPVTKKILKPEFDANIMPYTKDFLAARKNSKWGLISLNEPSRNKKFLYDELFFMSDSLVLVRKDRLWQVTSVYDEQIRMDSISEWSKIKDTNLLIFRMDKRYGILNMDGRVIREQQYAEIVFWRDQKKILFLGIRRIDQRNSFLEYFDEKGIVLRKQTISNELIESVICDN